MFKYVTHGCTYWRICLFAGLFVAPRAFGLTETGSFTGPSTTAFLSVDINGGPWSVPNAAASPTEGWNQSFSAPAYAPDPYGVSWVGWGGPTYDFGDGTQLPNSQAAVYGNSITKTFTGLPTTNIASGSTTVTISASGTPSAYKTVGTGNMDSFDWGTGWTGGATGPAFDIDMWRDFLQADGSGANVQSSNYLQVQFTGLNKNSVYTVSLYTYDGFYGPGAAATAQPPQTPNYEAWGWWDNQTTNPGNETFTAPSDEQVETWAAEGTPAAPATLTVITDGQGNGYVWTWGGNGQDPNSTVPSQYAATSFINGFQIGGGTGLLLGDTNGDGAVDATDLAALQANIGQTFTGFYSRGYAIGDFNGDGVVNQDDLALYMLGAAQYDAGHAAVPEPTGAVLTAAGVIAFGLKRRTNRPGK